MIILILFFGALMCVAGLAILANPEIIFGLLRNNSGKLALHILAVVVRLFLGVLLITQSAVSKYPLAIEIIGWLSMGTAVILAVIGRHNFRTLMAWALSFVKSWGRVGGILVMAFGIFLIHAFV